MTFYILRKNVLKIKSSDTKHSKMKSIYDFDFDIVGRGECPVTHPRQTPQQKGGNIESSKSVPTVFFAWHRNSSFFVPQELLVLSFGVQKTQQPHNPRNRKRCNRETTGTARGCKLAKAHNVIQPFVDNSQVLLVTG